MHLRETVTQDANRLAELFEQLGYSSSSSEMEVRLQTRVSNDYCKIFVAEFNMAVTGAIVLNIIQPLHEQGKWGVISALVVDESLRSSGVGAALLKHAEEHALEIGCTHVELSSSESRIRAHQFYQKHGFNEVRKRFVKRIHVL